MLYKKKLPLLIFLVPTLLMMLFFLYIPFIQNIGNSFYDMTGPVKMPGQEWKFIGLDNYNKLIHDPKVATALWNSCKMMVLTIVFQVGLGLVLAILVNSIKRGQQFFRMVYFFPIVISATAIGLLFKLFYKYDGGMLNQILASMGIEPVKWLSEKLAFLSISIPILWSYVGFYFVIMLTGLSDISDDIYEAADIDGCTKFKAVFYITLPLMRGVICTCITLAVTGALKIFDLPWVIVPNGAPNGVTHFMGTYMYEQAFSIGNVDYGSTISLMIVIFGIIVSQGINRLIKPDENL